MIRPNLHRGLFHHLFRSTTTACILLHATTRPTLIHTMSTSTTPSPSPRFRTWPITAASSIEPQLQDMGLRVPTSRIDGTSRSSPNNNASNQSYLSDALVSVGPAGRGGTGSFVSDDGLILTNWHVAYDAVRQASLNSPTGTDYVRDGFVSRSRDEEVPGPNYEAWITTSCVDVSDQVLEILKSETTDLLKRANRVRDVMQEIAQTAQQKAISDDGIGDGSADDGEGSVRCDVQEMLPNESYVLFTYQRLRDVRIVYVPPKSLGNFGGDTDNFEWPRHTADFTLLRAYVGPDGTNNRAAEYSPDNVPYRPQSRLRLAKNGASNGDMVFLLGFPGRTMRYAPSSRLQYSDEVAVPRNVQDFRRKLDRIATYEKDSKEAALKLGKSKKGLANELKRSEGKVQMMRKLGLLDERRGEEMELCQTTDEARKALDRLGEIYDLFRSDEPKAYALETCRGVYGGSTLLAVGHSLQEYFAAERVKKDGEREAGYRERNLPFLCRMLAKRLGDVHIPHEAALVRDAVEILEGTEGLEALGKNVKAVLVGNAGETDDGIEAAVACSKLRELDIDTLRTLVSNNDGVSDETLLSSVLNDPFVKCAAVLFETYTAQRDSTKTLFAERDELFASLLDLQRTTSGDDGEVFYPDCNGSLRISAGHVEGYEAADAVWHTPSTTLGGLYDKVLEKGGSETEEEGTTGGDDSTSEFVCPNRLLKMLSSKTEANGSIKNVPVCLLYSTDTVGGNSGSPVMNADGEFVAINFDRQRQGLMNEFKWSKDYSRSIGVDVRYILWLIGEYDGAKSIVDEMLE